VAVLIPAYYTVHFWV